MYRFHVKLLCSVFLNKISPPQFIIMNVFISSNRNQSTSLTFECTCYQENFEGKHQYYTEKLPYRFLSLNRQTA